MQQHNRIDLIRPDAPSLARPGPFPIGVTTREMLMPDYGLAAPRMLNVEVWYPAADSTRPGTTYRTVLRDGVTPVTYHGSACRDAGVANGIHAPLVVLSHGYPGNRFLMSHLAESLAARGYVVAAPDHAGSTYDDQQAFGQTLLHRPLDQRGVIDAVAALDGPLGALADCTRVGVIGFSMGGYGALVLGGAGLNKGALEHERAAGFDALVRHLAGSADHAALHDPRIKAILPIGPWGMGTGFWDAGGLAAMQTPMLMMAGTEDEISGYGAMRRIFAGTTGSDRYLLSFAGAGHNAAAPVPAPDESWAFSQVLGWAPFLHYADAVWDTSRMNNIAQHYAVAFLGLHLRGDDMMAAYLNGETWPGFAENTARGLTLEHRAKGT